MKLPIFFTLTLCGLVLRKVHSGPVDTIKTIKTTIGIISGSVGTTKTISEWIDGDKNDLTIPEILKELRAIRKEYAFELPQTIHAKDEIKKFIRALNNLEYSFDVVNTYLNKSNPGGLENNVNSNRIFNEIPEYLMQIYGLVFPNITLTGNPTKVIEILARQGEGDRKGFCGRISPRRYAYNLFEQLILAEITGFALFKLAYENKKQVPQFSVLDEASVTTRRTASIIRLNEYIAEIDTNLKLINREIKACDPPTGWEDEKSYYAMPRPKYLKKYENLAPGRLLSLRMEKSNARNNYVITGLRFIRDSGVLYIQIKEGRLGANLTISEEDWSPISRMHFDLIQNSMRERKEQVGTAYHQLYLNAMRAGPSADTGILELSENNDMLNGLSTNNSSDSEFVFNRVKFGLDFAEIHGKAEMLMDDIIYPSDHAIIGVGFKYVRTQQFNPNWYLTLQTMAMKFNYSTGKLIKRNRIYKQAELKSQVKDQTLGCPKEGFLNKGIIEKPLCPTDAQGPNIEDMNNNTILRFEYTNVENDMYRTFFDGVPVEAGTPLSGIGIFHKGVKCYGGFVSLRVFDMDHSYYFRKPTIDDH